jgi:methyl-accepting chemotaxis protein
MSYISTSCSKIVEISRVIDELAFQAKLLAVAGEADKGFTALAQEVRALAVRCANASKEINILIDSSVEGGE